MSDNYEVQAEEKSKELVIEAKSLAVTADELEIDCPEMYQFANDTLNTVKDTIKRGDTERLEITRPMDAAKKKVMEFFNRGLEPFKEVKGVLEQKIIAYDDAQEKIRLEKEEKLRKEQEAAQRKADKEAADKKAAADKLAQEAADKKAAAEKKAQEAKESGDKKAAEEAAEAQRIADEEAAAAEEAADEAEDAEYAADAVSMAPAIALEQQKAKGAGVRKTYAAEVTNLLELAKGVASGAVPVTAIKADQTVLNQMARAMKENMVYPGVKVVIKKNVAKS